MILKIINNNIRLDGCGIIIFMIKFEVVEKYLARYYNITILYCIVH